MEQVRFLNRKIDQAYEQAPWRRQLQMIGIFLLVVVSVALVAGIYLNVTSRAATFGREIQDMSMGDHVRLDLAAMNTAETADDEIPIEELKIQIADLEGKLANLTSLDVMQEKAERLGFQAVELEGVTYVPVPGYESRPEAMLAPPPEPVTAGTPVMPQAFRESLFDWLSGEVAKSWFLRSPADLLFKGIQP